MIIVKLMGGLGNQMFQYAAGKALASYLHKPLKIDTSFLLDKSPRKDFTYRDYELSCFNITEDIINDDELHVFQNRCKILGRFKIDFLNRVLFDYKIPLPKKIIYTDPKFSGSFFSFSDNTLIDGYWQSEKYFSKYSAIIKQAFSFRNPTDGKNAETLQMIKNSESVSVHIRRGDYANNQHINSVHGICDESYYTGSIDFITAKINNPVFFFFSDDMNWVKETFKELCNKYPVFFVDHNPSSKAFEDMRLMSNCKHNIIANSSFSWWGAWLNNYENKTIVAPEKWFQNSSINTEDLIPKSWIRL